MFVTCINRPEIVLFFQFILKPSLFKTVYEILNMHIEYHKSNKIGDILLKGGGEGATYEGLF